jgi:class 3 adenylate cyclase
VRDLKAHQSVVLPLIARYGGRIIDTAGDGILAEFPSVVGATECAIEIQTVMAARNQTVPEHRRMRFRIGINLGGMVHADTRIYGDGINIAARFNTQSSHVLAAGPVEGHPLDVFIARGTTCRRRLASRRSSRASDCARGIPGS